MFDFSHLPPARHQFVVIADTHYMLDVTGQSVEFDSRRRQTDRADFALRTLAGLGDLPVIHMGDLVQEFPERPGFAQAVPEALAQLAACGVAPRFVAGNHDVGDKPDPTMPADWVTPTYLADFHRRYGSSWQSWDESGLHFVILNSQILNSGLPAEAEQAEWLEADLQAHAGERIFLFLHLPPFLHNPAETSLGHYDNIDEPARSWLLALVQRHGIEMLFAAHIHWAFYNEIDSTRYYTVPSVAFTRPGFSELFASPPPPEQGRDDAGKLGFYLVRVMETDSRVHFVRTSGERGTPDLRPRLLTRTSPDLPASPLGVVLHHPLSRQGQTPSIWPSAVRQPVRNDYPLLAAQEVGLRYLLAPVSDLVDPLQRERLGILRKQGVALTARLLWRPGVALPGPETLGGCDGLQIDVLGDPVPALELAACLREWRQSNSLPVTLSCVLPNWAVPGKQHNRSQIGFLPGQLTALGQWLATNDLAVERVLCRMDASGENQTLLAQVEETDSIRPAAIGTLDWIVELPSTSTGQWLNRAAEALFALAARPGSRLFVEPFVELDRTMDVAEGLLDRLCNPTPVFHLLRNLNTLLFSETAPLILLRRQAIPGGYLLSGTRGAKAIHLLLPDAQAEHSFAGLGIDDTRQPTLYDLASGRRIEKELPDFKKPGNSFMFNNPTLLIGQSTSA